MDEFREALVRRFARREDGKRALNNLIERTLVESEQKRRKVEVTDEELDEYVAKVEKEVFRRSGGRNTLDGILKEKKLTREEFLRTTRDFLLRQKMAAEDLEVEGEVSEATLLTWMEFLKGKYAVVVGGDLPEGVVAKIGERSVTTDDLGRELLKNLRKSTLEGTLWDLVIAVAVDIRMEEAGVEITEKDVDEAIEELRAEFKADERFKQTTFKFEQYVQAIRMMTIEELRKDRLFLAQVGLARIVRGKITGQEVKEHYEKHRGRYGERRTFIHLLIKADERVKGTFTRKGRSLEQARKIIDVLLAKHRRGYPFEKLVQEESEDRSKYSRPDREIEVNRETQLPDTLKNAVFEAPQGEVVGPIRTTFGFHLVKVLEIVPDPGFEASRAEVVRDLVAQRRTRALLEIKQDPAIRLKY
jgi:parvulin-like peptidyl-prolyl isomerase